MRSWATRQYLSQDKMLKKLDLLFTFFPVCFLFFLKPYFFTRTACINTHSSYENQTYSITPHSPRYAATSAGSMANKRRQAPRPRTARLGTAKSG